MLTVITACTSLSLLLLAIRSPVCGHVDIVTWLNSAVSSRINSSMSDKIVVASLSLKTELELDPALVPGGRGCVGKETVGSVGTVGSCGGRCCSGVGGRADGATGVGGRFMVNGRFNCGGGGCWCWDTTITEGGATGGGATTTGGGGGGGGGGSVTGFKLEILFSISNSLINSSV